MDGDNGHVKHTKRKDVGWLGVGLSTAEGLHDPTEQSEQNSTDVV